MSGEHHYSAVYGDLHNHCNISYGHGELADALANAALRLDFVSITGHADWPDMDADDPRISRIVDFHKKGFARLKSVWGNYLEVMADWEAATGLVTYPGYEIHSNEHGDYTIVGRDQNLPMVLAESPDKLRALFRKKFANGSYLPRARAAHTTGASANHELPPVLLFPHHIGYRRGARGVNWDSFNGEFTPLVEICSMHGLADCDRSDKPSLHSMGPWQYYGTMENGLRLGKWFGVIGNTDHHSGFPGSYGHGLTGAWTESHDRNGIWQALYLRRTWAMTGDVASIWFAVDGVPMGAEFASDTRRSGSPMARIEVEATSAIDYVELRSNGRRTALWWDTPSNVDDSDEAIVELELGWGERGKLAAWEVSLGVTEGELLEVIPRFRGPEVVSPLDASGPSIPTHHSNLERQDNIVRFTTTTWGNVTNSTPSTQGVAVRVSSPATCYVDMVMNGVRERRAVSELLAGSVSGNLGPIDSPAYRLCATASRDYRRNLQAVLEDLQPGWLNVRARLKNGHWVISSPIRVVS